MKIVSFNVNGIRAILNKTFVDDFFALNADIFSINESKYSEVDHLNFPFEPEGYHTYWTNSKVRKGYSGVAVFTKNKPLSVHYGLKDSKYDDEGRVITLEFDNFYYVACYVPNAGDLNVAHHEIDLKNPKLNERNPGYTIEERNAFTNLLNHGFIDTFRYLYPITVKYSWWSYRFNARANNAGWRIDYFVVSDRIKDLIIDSKIHNEIYGSDHCPIELDINI